MSNIFRFYTLRGVEELPKNELDKLSIQTHPEDNQSEWYKMLERLCKLKDFKGIIKEILAYLKSKNAIHSINQLDSDFQKVFLFVENKGSFKNENDIKELLKVVDLRRFSDYFKEKEIKETDDCGETKTIKISKFDIELQKVTNTQLSLAIFGKLGHRENINYQLIFKVFHLLQLLANKKKDVTLAEIVQLFDKTMTFPVCFFKLNPCSKKLEPVQIENPFSHLGILNFDENISKSQLMSIRGKDYAWDAHDEYPGDITYTGGTTPVEFPSQSGSDKINECECNCDESCKGQNPCCATIKPFITDLMVVREELHCYKAKHLAYVETIMLGEERERIHRHLERTEDYSEKETTVNKSEEKDHQVSERFSLQTEAQKTIKSDLSTDTGVTANMWGTGYKVQTSLDVASQNSKSESQRVAREQAVDITERTVRKIQETVRELTTKKRIVETEETNTHSFKNRPVDGGLKHINGMYQFIDAEYKGQVMNYGKRLMFEFILPEPLEMYKKLMSKQIDPFEMDEPEKPLIDPRNISDDSNNPNYYLNFAKEKGAFELPKPPIKQKALSFSFFDDTKLNDSNDYASSKILSLGTVPTGYRTTSLHSYILAKGYGGGNNNQVWLFVNNTALGSGNNSINNIGITEGEQINGTLLFQSSCAVSGSGVIYCERLPSIYEAWQLSVYEKIMQEYEKDLNEYKAELARYNAAKAQKTKFGRNPFLNREIERTELKRMAISYISCQFYDQFTAMKRNVKPCGYPQMDIEQAQKDGLFIQFFEQLFDWNLMTYLFYSYFWGQKCDWANKVQEDSGDPLFDKALMAGAARVQVPVKSGHEPLAMYWITFGEIWQGTGQPPVPGSPYYISMAQEIKEQKGVFYADRKGVLEVWNGRNTIELTDSSYYWDFRNGIVDQLKIDNDIDREIILDCVTYRIIAIQEDTSDATHKTWKIKIERVYEGLDQSNLKWSTGALFVGAEFLITVPTNLVYLKNKKVNGEYVTEDCLPCFPQPKCE